MVDKCAQELQGRDVPQLAARVQRLPAHVRHHHQHHLVEEAGRGKQLGSQGYIDVHTLFKTLSTL